MRPQEMRSIEEIKKGMDGYIGYWRKMADSDESGEFRRKNDPVKEYWKGVREALDEPYQEREREINGGILANIKGRRGRSKSHGWEWKSMRRI